MYLSKHNISKLTLSLPTRATPQEATHTLVREDKGGVGPRIADSAGESTPHPERCADAQVAQLSRTREFMSGDNPKVCSFKFYTVFPD